MKLAIFGLIGSILMIVSLTSAAAGDGLPDILGIQLGMPLEKARALLVKNGDPKAQLKVLTTSLPTIGKPVTVTLLHAPNKYGTADVTNVDVALPPNNQVVWRVDREHFFPDNGIPRDTLLAALREKYGEETDIYTPLREATTDNQITELWWLFDEQGGRVEQLPSLRGDMGFFHHGDIRFFHHICSQGGSLPGLGDGFSATLQLVRNGPPDDPRLDACYSSYIAVHAMLALSEMPQLVKQMRDGEGEEEELSEELSEMPELVKQMRVIIVNLPFAARAGTATKAWMNDIDERKHKQDIEKAKQKAKQQKKPKL